MFKKLLVVSTLGLLCCCPLNIVAQEPGNNLGKSYYQCYKEWGGSMYYIGNSEKGNEYIIHSDGMDIYFTFRNDRLVDELLLVASRNGFARQCYDNFRGTFVNESNYQKAEQYTNMVVLYYSYFKIEIAYMVNDAGEEQCWLHYLYK